MLRLPFSQSRLEVTAIVARSLDERSGIIGTASVEIDSAQLVELFRQGDQDAAQALFERYVDRLVSLAHKRLSSKLSRRIDAEDIVQSVFRSFFGHLEKGRYSFDHSGELWHLLAAITLNKIRRKVEINSARKRGYDLEQSVNQGDSGGYRPEAMASEPSGEDVLMMVEEIEMLTEGLDEVQKKIVELRLSGYKIDEIADEVNLSERTVRRVMDKVKSRLELRCQEST